MIIGTLGNKDFPSTCSYAAAQNQFVNHQIELFETFEQAISFLKRNEIDMVVIPAAYPNINPIIMDENLKVVETFLYNIPNLVLATNVNRDNFDTLYLHPATLSLVDKIDKSITFSRVETVNSNTDAAMKVHLSQNNICITNQLCIEPHHLKILQIIKPTFIMPFICFKKKGESKL